ncbi:MAG: S-layer homology domain-containing protein [Clostridiales bacterium]|nr:S-layer homology domain-containing protein [Clostridiales bacterium]
MKKFASLLLSIALLLSLCVPASAANLSGFEKKLDYKAGQFADIPVGNPWEANVKTAYEFGIMNGVGNSKFEPGGNVTVVQAIIMACRLHDTYYANEGNFKASGTQPYWEPYVKYALEQGIIVKEYESYNSPIDRASFAMILGASLPNAVLPAVNTVVDGAIPDVKAGADYYDAVYRLYRAGILQGGDAKGTFAPSSNITRGEAAAIVSRMASESLRKTITLDTPYFTAVPMKQLTNLKSIQKGASDAELTKAYDAALKIVAPYAGMSREEQLYGIASGLRQLAEDGMEYSTTAAHCDDPYGYFVLGVTSSAGCARAVALCLNMLGIPYEHVNEDQPGHQWCRVNVNGTYWICDAYGLYCGPEPAPYEHPYL